MSKSKVSKYNLNLHQNEKKEQQVLATKIKIIISEHDLEVNGEESIVYNEIIKLQNKEHASSQELITALGSIRGVKNKVKERIGQFLTGDFNKIENGEINGCDNDPNEDIKSLKSKDHANVDSDKSKIIVYTTSLGIIRGTKGDCLYLNNVFRSLMLKTEERDIVSQYYHDEFKQLFPNANPPQVVIKSFQVGGRKEVEELIESGEIYLLTKGIERVKYSLKKCSSCSGYGYCPCPVCLGSCRSRIIRIGKTREVNNLKCTHCKQGMVRCVDCINMISY